MVVKWEMILGRNVVYRYSKEPIFDGAEFFVGKHEYKGFSTAKKSKSTVRTVESIDIYEGSGEIEIKITADDFLHNMARFMVGILIEIGQKKRKPEDIRDILEGKEGVVISPPAEACGLFLQEVKYQA